MMGKLNPAGYKLTKGCETITDNVNKKLRPDAFSAAREAEGSRPEAVEPLMTNEETARLAKVMLGIFFLAVFLWATEALPLGATDILVAY